VGACVPQLLVVAPLLVSNRVIHLLLPVDEPTWMPTNGLPVSVTSWPVTNVPHEYVRKPMYMFAAVCGVGTALVVVPLAPAYTPELVQNMQP